MKMGIPFLLLIALTNCAHLFSASPSQVKKNRVLYSEGRVYKRTPELAASPQSHLCEEQCYKNEVGHNNTHGIVSLCYFFR
jgi:hypothetical protein